MAPRLARNLARNPLAGVLLVTGLALFYGATRLAMRSLDGGPGPGLLPAALGVLMAVLAAWVLFVEPRPAAAPGELRRVGAMAGGLALYAAVLEAVGFVIATAALTVGLLALFNERGRAWLAALGVAGTVTSYWLFHTLLKVQLPADPFGIWR